MHIVIVGGDVGSDGEVERTFIDMGLDWDVRRIADAAEALALPPETSVDVFVSAMSGGLQQGVALMAQLRGRFPEAMRILLLDEGNGFVASEALEYAHRLLHRPLDPCELAEAVESVVDLRELLDNDELKQAIGRAGSLPPPPRLYLDLIQLLRDPEAGNDELAELLSQDPAIVAKVLRLCNSAYFSNGRVVTDIRVAVTRLGQQALHRLVLATEAYGGSGTPGVDREAMQDRALRTSRLAGRLLAGPSAELAATAGLLAEVGRLLPGVRGRDDPADAGGPHYAEAGAYLLGMWGLPMPIVEAVARHHDPGGRRGGGGFWVAGAVHVAAALVAEAPVDEDYLRSVGMLDKLPLWRSMLEPVAEVA